MKKIYMKPNTEIVRIGNVDALCDGLIGWSAIKESNGKPDSGGNAEKNGEDPEFGLDAKRFNAWTTWDE